MFKKALAIAGAGAVLLSMAVPVFGYYHHSGIDISNHAFVSTNIFTKADSGDNSIGGMMVSGSPRITSGAAGAYANVLTDVNSSELGCFGCNGDVDIHNRATVLTRLTTKADSGDNSIGGMCVSGGAITSGATNAQSIVAQSVNYSAVGFPLH